MLYAGFVVSCLHTAKYQKGAEIDKPQLLPSFVTTILLPAIHSGWPNAGAAAFLLLCEGNFGT